MLAGWTPGVALDERGNAQAAALPGRLAALPIAEVVASPLQRCQETLQPLLDARPDLRLHTEERIGECHYGDWSGRKLAELKDEPLMEVVQSHPSSAAFPGGESMRAMQTRAAEAVREWNARVERDHGSDAVYLMCSHGDIIKSLVADALGLHLDLFQRISVEPCSITAIRYTVSGLFSSGSGTRVISRPWRRGRSPGRRRPGRGRRGRTVIVGRSRVKRSQ